MLKVGQFYACLAEAAHGQIHAVAAEFGEEERFGEEGFVVEGAHDGGQQ